MTASTRSFRQVSDGRVNAGARAYYAAFLRAFPDVHFDLHDIVVIHFHGTQRRASLPASASTTTQPLFSCRKRTNPLTTAAPHWPAAPAPEAANTAGGAGRCFAEVHTWPAPGRAQPADGWFPGAD